MESRLGGARMRRKRSRGADGQRFVDEALHVDGRQELEDGLLRSVAIGGDEIGAGGFELETGDGLCSVADGADEENLFGLILTKGVDGSAEVGVVLDLGFAAAGEREADVERAINGGTGEAANETLETTCGADRLQSVAEPCGHGCGGGGAKFAASRREHVADHGESGGQDVDLAGARRGDIGGWSVCP